MSDECGIIEELGMDAENSCPGGTKPCFDLFMQFIKLSLRGIQGLLKPIPFFERISLVIRDDKGLMSILKNGTNRETAGGRNADKRLTGGLRYPRLRAVRR